MALPRFNVSERFVVGGTTHSNRSKTRGKTGTFEAFVKDVQDHITKSITEYLTNIVNTQYFREPHAVVHHIGACAIIGSKHMRILVPRSMQATAVELYVEDMTTRIEEMPGRRIV